MVAYSMILSLHASNRNAPGAIEVKEVTAQKSDKWVAQGRSDGFLPGHGYLRCRGELQKCVEELCGSVAAVTQVAKQHPAPRIEYEPQRANASNEQRRHGIKQRTNSILVMRSRATSLRIIGSEAQSFPMDATRFIEKARINPDMPPGNSPTMVGG